MFRSEKRNRLGQLRKLFCPCCGGSTRTRGLKLRLSGSNRGSVGSQSPSTCANARSIHRSSTGCPMASVCEACVCKSGIHVATYRNLTESRRPCTISLIVSLRSSLTPLSPPHHPLQVAARCNKGVIPLSSRPGRAWLADDTWQRRFRTVNAAMEQDSARDSNAGIHTDKCGFTWQG